MRTRTTRTTFIGAALALACLTACGEGDEDKSIAGVSTDSPSATSSQAEIPSVTVSPTPTPTPGPDGDRDGVEDANDTYPGNPYASGQTTITVTCDFKGGTRDFVIDRGEPDFSEAWAPLPEQTGDIGGGVYCESYDPPSPSPASAVEAKLLKLDKRPDEYTLSIPYEQCIEHGTKWTTSEWPVGKQQVPEAEAALMLCPTHPDAAAIRERIGGQGQLEQELKDGTAFYDGTYRVGTRVKPGTYVVDEGVEGCYWERLDSAGNIVDNNFISSAPRVEMTIQSSDFAVHTEGCGLWRAVR